MYGNARRVRGETQHGSGKARRSFARISKLRAARACARARASLLLLRPLSVRRELYAVNYTSRDINWIPSRDEETIDIFPLSPSPPSARALRAGRY